MERDLQDSSIAYSVEYISRAYTSSVGLNYSISPVSVFRITFSCIPLIDDNDYARQHKSLHYNTRAPNIAAAEATSNVAQASLNPFPCKALFTVVSSEKEIAGVMVDELEP